MKLERGAFKDHFSGHAGAYAAFRPGYPAALFHYLASLCSSRALAVDCATGSGQAAMGLAPYFGRVVACDASEAQLAHASRDARIVYVASLAERLAIATGRADLLAVAQAAHWFDAVLFNAEARRVLRPRGVIAMWTYGLARVSASIDAQVRWFYDEVIGGYWPSERRHVESAYRDLSFPWRELASPAFELTLRWDLDDFIGYVGTWSAVQRCIRKTGGDPLPGLRAGIESDWNSVGQGRSVTWPLHLRVGVND